MDVGKNTEYDTVNPWGRKASWSTFTADWNSKTAQEGEREARHRKMENEYNRRQRKRERARERSKREETEEMTNVENEYCTREV